MIVLGVHSKFDTECTRIFEIAIAILVLRRILTPEMQPGVYIIQDSIHQLVGIFNTSTRITINLYS